MDHASCIKTNQLEVKNNSTHKVKDNNNKKKVKEAEQKVNLYRK